MFDEEETKIMEKNNVKIKKYKTTLISISLILEMISAVDWYPPNSQSTYLIRATRWLNFSGAYAVRNKRSAPAWIIAVILSLLSIFCVWFCAVWKVDSFWILNSLIRLKERERERDRVGEREREKIKRDRKRKSDN